jgi:uncharacterized protein DUF1153
VLHCVDVRTPLFCNSTPLAFELLMTEDDARCADDGLFFIGPDGTPIKLDDLPPRGFKDWQPRHKAMVVAAVRHGLITVDQACARYNLSIEEYLSWYQCYGPPPPASC